MTTIELYINNRLVDIESPESFSIYLKRQLVNPAELSRKDAQKSYDITLPATPTNNKIFKHINVEEVKDKFAQLYDARLWVGGVNIFEGKFKLSEITRTSYKGNLGIPAQKSTKDIFGDKNMNEAPEWLLDFQSISDMSDYNKKEDPTIIFPFVLYGLMDKGKKNEDDKPTTDCSPKNVLDGTASFDYKDFKPSPNCVQLLKHLFDSEGLNLTGTALEDERINKLYVSYKNPEDYDPKWPQGKIKVTGTWNNTYQKDGKWYFDDVFEACQEDVNEMVHNYTEGVAKATYIKRLINDGSNNNINIEIENDWASSVNLNRNLIEIPTEGLYKIRLSANIELSSANDDKINSLQHPYGGEHKILSKPRNDHRKIYHKARSLNGIMLEVKLLRNFYDYSPNNKNRDGDPIFTDNVYNSAASYYPKRGELNLIDISQNKYLLCGLSWGKPYKYNEKVERHPYFYPFRIYKNPSEPTLDNPDDEPNYSPCCNLLATKNELMSDDGEYFPLHATECGGYYKSANNLMTNVNKLNIKNIPANRVSIKGNNEGSGEIYQVVWLKKGETLSPICTSSLRTVHIDNTDKNDYFWTGISVSYELEVEPFKYTKDWLKVEKDGTNAGAMDWNSKSDFKVGEMDVVKFLPSNIKINDWIDNFCKAFNLELKQVNATDFQLNVKKVRVGVETAKIIDLDAKASVTQGRNQSLLLPYAYDLGFTIDKNEHGYWNSMARKEYDEADEATADDGGGIYYTQSPEEKKVEQKSSFSYNWYKKIINKLDKDKEIEVPIISDKEAWANTIFDYGEYNSKRYFDKAQRFWYRKGTETVQINLKESTNNLTKSIGSIDAALLTNSYKSEAKELNLNYKNEPNSIMDNFFLLLADAGNSYTTVECYLTPEEYASIADSWVRFNGDLYYVAEVDGYDPLAKKQATLKLIRKML